ncbi:MAG: hypothetical protein ACO3EJ_01180 [Ilumatobacteraceae bacterium]|jgi:hypothetical protein
MKAKLLESWYSLCRDAARQRIVVISFSVFCGLVYFVSAMSLNDEKLAPAVLQSASRYEIPNGFRAVAMQSAGPLPILQNGNHVDVIIDSAIVLEQVLVIDIAEQSGRQATIVLAVPVENSAMIANAAALGVVSLVLVG